MVAPALVGSALPGGSVQAEEEYTSPEYLQAKKDYEEALSKVVKCKDEINKFRITALALKANANFDIQKECDVAYLNGFLKKVVDAEDLMQSNLESAEQLYKDAISFAKEFLKLRDAYSKKFPEEFMKQLYEANEDSCKRFDSLLFQYGKQGKNSEYDGIYSLEFESSISSLKSDASDLNILKRRIEKRLDFLTPFVGPSVAEFVPSEKDYV